MICANQNGYSMIRISQEDIFYDRTDWKNELIATIKIYQTTSNILISSVYEKFSGRVNGEKYIETRQFDRRLIFSAKDNVLNVKGKDIDISFDRGVVVSQPIIIPDKRETECNQLTHIIEYSVYLDLGAGCSVRITPGSFILAFQNSVVVVYPPQVHADNAIDAAKALDSDSKKLESFPSTKLSAISRLDKQ